MRQIACALLVSLSSAAFAEEAEPTLAPDGEKKLESTAIDPRKDEDSTDTRRYLLAAGESVVLFGGGAVWYWVNSDLQKPDWDLAWDWKSWKTKLTSFDAVRFDTNPIHVNMWGHTGQAVAAYHIGRGNGLGLTGATLLNMAHAVGWEYFIEYREYVSLNDLIVNTVSGPALGEPLWQIGDYFRSGPKSLGNEVLAAIFQPFDEIEHRVNRRGWQESARPWHRFELAAGTSAEDTGTYASIDLDLEVVSFDRSGARNGWTPAGGWSRLAGGLRFADGVAGGHLYSRTSYGGYQSRAVYDSGVGRSMFLGFGTGITYENSDLGMTRDQFAAYHLIGPQTDLHVRTADVDVRLQAAAYGDLGMVNAHALAGMPPIDPVEPYASPLTRPGGYYFGVGGTAWTRLLVEWNRVHVDLEAHGHKQWSLDEQNADRGQPPPPQNLTDRRLYGHLALGYEVVDGVALTAAVDLAGRRGTVEGGMPRASSEQRYGLLLTLLR